eukprot:COSAG04_NODE_20499_length_392_cov_0.849829_1_plen_98_part_01
MATGAPQHPVGLFVPCIFDTAAVEHRYWDNDEPANMVCRGLGFASGTIYTYGATAMPLYTVSQGQQVTVPGLLPVVSGFRSCTGTEVNIFQCPQCGNR